jgi:mono/diheme cytochrome c family protein
MNLQKPAVLALLLTSSLHGADTPKTPPPAEEFPPMPPVQALTPEETLKTMQLPKGYRMEVVLSEPHIQEPVAAAFDGSGRMFVAEMRTYMQDADGTNEHAPTSRVSLHWSSKGDGKFDKHAVFADNLLLPRMILPLGRGELLINETDTQDIYLYKDTDGDGKSDQKTLWFEGGPRGGNMEHQQSGLIWAIDNWMYMTYNNWRLRWRPGAAPVKEPISANGGQWGLTQDDYGKPWIVNAGGELGPVNFQTHVLYGGFSAKNQFSEDYKQVWPAVGIADVQGGANRYRPEDKTLNHFTATCGAEVFRGDRLPADLRGDLLFSEPVGRLIRRTKAEVKDGLTYLKNAYDKGEFIRSTDPLSRVVNMNTAPDGTLYLVDMYRGIIQEGNWVKEGSYLRKVVQQYALDKQVAHGRIWRLVHDDFKPGPQPRLDDAKPAELVAALEHPNGWWRDTAQKLLVLRQDRSVTPALVQLADEGKSPLSRIHALWTLEGLDAADANLVRRKLKDSDPQVRAAAIRVSETLVKAGDSALLGEIVALCKDSDPAVAMQALCSARLLDFKGAGPLVQASLSGAMGHMGMREIAMQMLAPKRGWGREFNGTQKGLLTKGNEVFNELCFTCHNPDGRGTPIEGKPGATLAPPLAGSRTVTGPKEAFVAVLLKGLAGPINNKTYDSQMVPMESNDDYWIAAVASYARNSFGNKASTVDAKDVAAMRAQLKDRTAPFTIPELATFGPATVANRNEWKLNASHNAAALLNAVDGKSETRFDTKAQQSPGMWMTVEFPQETQVAGIRLDAGHSAGDFPRGYKIEISKDGVQWEKPVAEGKGSGALTEVFFSQAKAKSIRITLTAQSEGSYWSVHELDVIADPKPASHSQAIATR